MEAAPAPKAPAAPAEAHTSNIALWRGASWTLAATGGWPQGWGTGLTCPRRLGGHDQEGLWGIWCGGLGNCEPQRALSLEQVQWPQHPSPGVGGGVTFTLVLPSSSQDLPHLPLGPTSHVLCILSLGVGLFSH